MPPSMQKLHGQTITFAASPTMTVDELKGRIAEITLMPIGIIGEAATSDANHIEASLKCATSFLATQVCCLEAPS